MSTAANQDNARQVQSMFARIAQRYDLLNRLMTLGQDRGWRKELIQGLNLHTGERLLDVGTGSGDLAYEARRQHPELTVIACDFTPEMIAVGRAQPAGPEVSWVLADAENLPFQKQTFDAVVSGFLLRNVTDLDVALSEQRRVLKNRGWFGALDTTPPESAVLKPLLRFHFHRVIPFLGRWLAGDIEAYRYLPESTESFLPARALAKKIKQRGFKSIGYVKRMLGTIAIHWAQR